PAGPIWAKFMHDASIKLAEKDFIKPDNVVVQHICLDSGQVATDLCPRSIGMAFIEGTQPEDLCSEHSFWMDKLNHNDSWWSGNR
ncbi:MAG: hypothetical protein PHC92_05805, partial [Syntrophomonadaceae bacterium]|nr:hypothetical protein [Syntrophomonadaceae bacterium]